MTDFQITPDDTIYVALGTAAQGIASWLVRKERPNWFFGFPAVAMITAVGLGSGYMGMTKGNIPRAAAAFAIGFGMSQVVSYLLPRVTGGATPAAGVGYEAVRG
jgi:hypothetical protein